ncbi:dipeptidase [Streptomyces sp. TRM 70351]|nr:dipeptidase [Streptomyces sp. TRM 70351]MEE1929240.1 dipeptidase [Streptomyces sp. TRM 70351]
MPSEDGDLEEVTQPGRGVIAVPVRECGEKLVDLRAVRALRLTGRLASSAPALLRLGVVDRLVTAQTMLPVGLRLLVLDAYRPAPAGARPGCSGHETGAAADLTLCMTDGAELWPGAVGFWPDRGADARTACSALDPVAAEHLSVLSEALSFAGMSNYPEVWWHWSHGDRSWAYQRGVGHARYGPVGR